MKVLQLSNSNAPFFRDHIKGLRRQGIEVDVKFVPGESTADDEAVSHRSIFDYLRFYPEVLMHSFDDYDLIQANYGTLGPIALAQPNLPVLLCLWGSDILNSRPKISKVCAKRSDAVVVMSREMAKICPGDVSIIPFGIDFEKFHPIDQELSLSKVGWDKDAKHVLFPYPKGREEKNFPLANEVVELADRKVSGELELHPIHGIPHDEMPYIMNAADVMLLTSDHEGSPNTVKESLACNTPFVSTDVGDISEWSSGIDGAFVGQSKEELARGIVDKVMSKNEIDTRSQCWQFSLENRSKEFLSVYQQIRNSS